MTFYNDYKNWMINMKKYIYMLLIIKIKLQICVQRAFFNAMNVCGMNE